MKDDPSDAKDRLIWKWLAGSVTTVGDFGDPAGTLNDYALCLYDASADPQPRLEAVAPAGAGCGKAADGGTKACWKAASTGFKYRDKARSPDGVLSVALKAGANGKAAIKAKGTGDLLPTPTLPLAPPVRAQLQVATGECWEALYSNPSINDGAQFNASSD